MSATRIVVAGTVLALAACQPAGQTGGLTDQDRKAALPDAASTEPYAGIAADEVVRLIGTEPFWGGQVAGNTLTYSTPDNPDGSKVSVERFAGRGGLSFSGTLDGAALAITGTELACSDGMSDRKYPFTVTLKIGDETRRGCGWSEQHPFEGPERP